MDPSSGEGQRKLTVVGRKESVITTIFKNVCHVKYTQWSNSLINLVSWQNFRKSDGKYKILMCKRIFKKSFLCILIFEIANLLDSKNRNKRKHFDVPVCWNITIFHRWIFIGSLDYKFVLARKLITFNRWISKV